MTNKNQSAIERFNKEWVKAKLNPFVGIEVRKFFEKELVLAEQRGREEATQEIEDTLIKTFMNTNFDGGVDKGEDEHWHYFFGDTVFKKLESVFKKLKKGNQTLDR